MDDMWAKMSSSTEMFLRTGGNLKRPHSVGKCKERALGEDVRSVISR